MGIFTGMEMLFSTLGAASVLLVFGLVHLRRTHHLDWKAMALGGLGSFFFLFTIAWAVSSMLEGEPQAASMGMLVFGFPALVIFGFFKRSVAKASAHGLSGASS